METATRRLAIVSVSLGICVATLIPARAGLMEAWKIPGIPFRSFALGFRTFSAFDVIQNIALFLPLGCLLAAGPRGDSRRGLARAALFCFLLSASVEWAQAWIPGRFPSCWDVLFNTIGGMIGAGAARRARAAFPAHF